MESYQSDDLSGFPFVIGDGFWQDDDSSMALSASGISRRARRFDFVLGVVIVIDVAERRDRRVAGKMFDGCFNEARSLGQVEHVHLFRVHDAFAVAWNKSK